MPTFQREDLNDLNFILTTTLTPSDYESDFDAELGKYRKQAALKGFRKGKTPASVLRKMFGKSVLAEVLNKHLQQAIEDFARQNNLNTLGGPIPLEDNERVDLNVREMEDYTFRFEIGIAPEFDVKGAGPESEYSRYAVEITDAMLDESLQGMREEAAQDIPVQEGFLESDEFSFSVVELAGEAPRPNGLSTQFSARGSQIKDEALRASVLAARAGQTLRVNLFASFDVAEEVLRKEWLGLDEADGNDVGEWFDATIETVMRSEPAPLNQEFFDTFFGEGRVSSEAEAREMLRKDLEQMYLRPASSLMFVGMRSRILEETTFELPSDFLKKWLAYSNEDMPEDAIENGFESFVENLRWTLIRNKLAEKLDIEVTDGELEEFFRRRVRGYFGASPYINEDFINDMAKRLMEREEGVREAYEEIFTDKLFYGIASQVTIAPKPISKEDFDLELEAAKKRFEAAQAPPAIDADEETDEAILDDNSEPALESEE